MNLEKAKELFLVENKILEKEEEQLLSLIKNIKGLLPYALKKIRNIEDFEMTFPISKINVEMKKNMTFEAWNQFISIEESRCNIIAIGDFSSIVARKEYRQKIEAHFQELGWNCQVVPRSFWHYPKIIISYPKVSFWKKVYFRLLNLFAKEKIQSLPVHPYR